MSQVCLSPPFLSISSGQVDRESRTKHHDPCVPLMHAYFGDSPFYLLYFPSFFPIITVNTSYAPKLILVSRISMDGGKILGDPHAPFLQKILCVPLRGPSVKLLIYNKKKYLNSFLRNPKSLQANKSPTGSALISTR